MRSKGEKENLATSAPGDMATDVKTFRAFMWGAQPAAGESRQGACQPVAILLSATCWLGQASLQNYEQDAV